jgi:uncharacterized protein YebE (UPF0316 family)
MSTKVAYVPCDAVTDVIAGGTDIVGVGVGVIVGVRVGVGVAVGVGVDVGVDVGVGVGIAEKFAFCEIVVEPITNVHGLFDSPVHFGPVQYPHE